MPDPIDPNLLHRRWLHSREEDTGDEMVFRPESYDFPPARGRTGFELSPDGSVLDLGVGPTDRPEVTAGTSRPAPSRAGRSASAPRTRSVWSWSDSRPGLEPVADCSPLGT
jgi:hypothetical protein